MLTASSEHEVWSETEYTISGLTVTMLLSVSSTVHEVVLFVANTLYTVVLAGETSNVIALPVPTTELPTFESSASNRN